MCFIKTRNTIRGRGGTTASSLAHHGKHTTAIVVRVFAYEVDPTRSKDADGRALVLAEPPAKLFHRLLAQSIVLRALGSRRRPRLSHSSLWRTHSDSSLPFGFDVSCYHAP